MNYWILNIFNTSKNYHEEVVNNIMRYLIKFNYKYRINYSKRIIIKNKILFMDHYDDDIYHKNRSEIYFYLKYEFDNLEEMHDAIMIIRSNNKEIKEIKL